jgi:hypothetical protein
MYYRENNIPMSFNSKEHFSFLNNSVYSIQNISMFLILSIIIILFIYMLYFKYKNNKQIKQQFGYNFY